MQLKKIILKGFKSFPDKTTLEFNEGVTAIVGPNGSGKSNIIEAIRWVMGEQSAKTLRGERMYDVIFSGTNERKPLNIAEVELILDNSDGYLDVEFEEVSVLRRISRTGDSTYMINQQECRLRDILDLFMDSGLGRESFSIISQGQVEAVFNSKPEDRRGIFEEAAGVYKYKVRKRDAERKLEQTQENLDRVQDILYELEAQLEPLKKQSDIAQSYLNQKEKLTDLDIGVTVWQIKDLKKQMGQDQKKLASITKEFEQLTAQIEHLESEKNKESQKLMSLEASRDALSEEIVEVVRERERTEAGLNLYDEKARHREVFIQEKELAIEQLKKRKAGLQEEVEERSKEFQENHVALTKLSKEIKSLQDKQAYLEGDKEAQMEELRSQYIEALQKQTSLKNEINYLKQEQTRSEKEGTKTQSFIEDLQKQLAERVQTLEEKEAAYEKVSEELLHLLQTFQDIEKNLLSEKEEAQRKNQRLAQTSQELERAKAKQNSLEEMQENYAGYYSGVRAVMKEKEKLDGIIGTVAELIKIPDQFLQAIDTVLGSSGQFVVVENEKAAREAISFLKQTKRGRATFLPLTTIKARSISKQILMKVEKHSGFLGIASEIVEHEQRLAPIIDNLLGQTLIAENLEAANDIARAIGFRHRVVSLEGDVMNAGGSMTGGGGRQNNTSPIFTQKAELTTVTKFIAENEKVLAHLNDLAEESLETIDALEKKIQEVRSAGEEKRLIEQALKNEVEHLREEKERLSRELQATNFEETENKRALDAFKEQLKAKETVLSEVTKAVETSNEQMQLLSSEQETIDEEKNKLSKQVEQLNEERNNYRELLATVKTNRENLEAQIIQLVSEIENLEKDIQSFDDEIEVDSKEALEKRLIKWTNEEERIQKEQKKVREDLNEQNQKIKEVTQKIQTLSGRNSYLSEEKSTLNIQLSKNDVRMDHHLDYLVDEYKIGFEEAKLLDEPEVSFQEAQKQVRLLKKGIEELGPVNVNAIEEYEQVHGRYDFLSTQQNDLIEAKVQLFNTMDEMDAIVEKQFKETFDRIQEEFAKVFPKMFGGGYAELVLNQPDNLLETGIEIIAQPPGKRLTRLSLLSGGERALTAISLLFAIIQVNPIPFCILDEAEAALDDANVVRFGKYLEEFEEDTQFIVITHRKGTMEHADQLYGVTMQEKGISKIVAVSLSEAQEMEGVT